MALTNVDAGVTAAGNLNQMTDVFYGYFTGGTSNILANGTLTMSMIAAIKALPSPLPNSLTTLYPTVVSLYGTNGTFLFVKLIRLGSLDIGANVFTADATTAGVMPTMTELGVSRTIHSALFVVVTTTCNASAGSITVTYTDQDGNAAETTTAQVVTVSSVAGSVGQVILNAADLGARSVTAMARSSGTMTGVIDIYGFIPITTFSPIGVVTESLYANSPILIPMLAGQKLGLLNMTTPTTQKTVIGAVTYVGV